MRLGFSIIAQPFSLNQYYYTVLVYQCWTQLPSFCFIIQVMTVLKMLSLASKNN